MTAITTTSTATFALALMLGAIPALAHAAPQPHYRGKEQQEQMGCCAAAPGPGMMGQGMCPGMMGQGMGPGMMGQSMCPGMMGQSMCPGMMGQGMGPGMMGQSMGPGMMGPSMGHGMMGQGMGPGMMGLGTMGHHPMRSDMMMGQRMGSGVGGWSGLEGGRVVPMMQLSADDVRIFFERYLESLGNARLKVGKITEMDNDTIAAEIVTVDDSLVEQFEVDRHTGEISAAS
jgi:hypothetical protein